MPDYAMYTPEADQVVSAHVEALLARIRDGQLRRIELPNAVAAMVRDIGKVHREVNDTEPEWAIVDAVNVECAAQGWAPVSRDDLWDASYSATNG